MKEMKEELAKPRTAALYASLDSSYCYVMEVIYTKLDERWDPLPNGEVREKPIKGYVRISEPIELTFRAVSDDAIVANAVKSLDEAEREALNELNTKIAAIRAQKAQLLALTHQSETV